MVINLWGVRSNIYSTQQIIDNVPKTIRAFEKSCHKSEFHSGLPDFEASFGVLFVVRKMFGY